MGVPLLAFVGLVIMNKEMFVQNPYSINAATLSKGKELFEQYCLQCHGAFGRGDGVLAVNLPVKPSNLNSLPLFPAGFIEFAIKYGGDTEVMPAWEKVLSADEIQLVGLYIRTFNNDFNEMEIQMND